MSEIRVAIDTLCTAQGWTTESWERGLLRAADRNHDDQITVAELDRYVATPRDGAFVSRRHLDSIATGSSPWQRHLRRTADAAGNRDGTASPEELAAYFATGATRVFTDQEYGVIRAEVSRLSGARDHLAGAMVCSEGRLIVRDYSEACYSDALMVPLGVAYTITPTDFREDVPRRDAFREDPELPTEARSTLTDYRRSGFDRGHLRPAEDSPTAEAMSESFLLSNMSPQYPNVNQQCWRTLEAAVREYVDASGGTATILTGNLFLSDDGTERALTPAEVRRMGRVGIPTHLYKCVLITMPDGSMRAATWVVPNSPTLGTHGPEIATTLREGRRSIDWLERRVGEDLFAEISNKIEGRIESSTYAIPLLPAETVLSAH